ncbi:MAG: NUDIX domain-containing protein [Chloroflexota bacterium]
MNGLQKVTAFVTRGTGPAAELLVFRHPTAGVQVPAGTVEIGETVEAAVLREVYEETGLANVQIMGKLQVSQQTLSQDERVVWRMTKVFDAPAADASGTGFLFRRGTPVRYLGADGKFARVSYEEYDLNQPATLPLVSVNGWVRRSILTDRLERHHFHLTTGIETPAAWPVFSDGHFFQLYWAPLQPRPRLIPPQDSWLEEVYAELLARTT